jgi:hypothetical protein
LAANPGDRVTYSDFDLIDEHSRPVRRVATRDFDARDLVLDLVCQPGPGAFFRREAFLRAGPWNPELRQNPDLDFWLRLSLVGSFLRIPKVLAGFRVHEGSATYQSTNIPRADEPVLITSRFMATAGLPNWIVENRNRVIATGCIASAQLHLRAGRPGLATPEDFFRLARQLRNDLLPAIRAFAAQRIDRPLYPPDPVDLGKVENMTRRAIRRRVMSGYPPMPPNPPLRSIAPHHENH